MELTADQMGRMSRLLDGVLPLDAPARRHWLESLPPEDADLLEALRAVLLLPEVDGAAGLGSLSTLFPAGVGVAVRGLGAGEDIGPYRLLRLLGVGGMAEVWLAMRADGAFRREVALKLPLVAHQRGDLEQRFAREREILASLSHPHIARLYDAGFTSDGRSYLALEYVAGTPLTKHCDERRMPLRARLQLFRQVLSAVQYAHSHLVIHRDLKPSNILVTAEGEARLLDFGIAKLLSGGEARETELTQLSGRALTPDYASPEQIVGAPVTTAADVYALGVILYELLTGERPYRLKRDSRGALEEAIVNVDSLRPSRVPFNPKAVEARATSVQKLRKQLRGDLDTILLKALHKRPADRYVTVAALHEDIARYLEGEVVLAQPASLVYRTRKFASRHWLAITIAAVIAVSLAAGLAATAYEARVAASQRDLARQAALRSLTQTAAARLSAGDVEAAMNIILEVLTSSAAAGVAYSPEALGVFQQAHAADAQLLVISPDAGRIWSANFSPDGQRIVTGSDDGTVRIWDLRTARELMRLHGHTDRVFRAAFSPDGLRIVTASYDGTARVWDSATGSPLAVLRGHTGKVWAAAFSPDGARVVTGGDDDAARVWEAVSGRELLRLIGHTDRVLAAAYSPDGTRIATGSHDHTARIWDAATGRLLRRLDGHTEMVSTVQFSPDGRRLVTGSHDRSVRLWDVDSGRELALLTGHTDRVRAAAFSPDGQSIVTAATDNTARIWDASSGQQVTVLRGHADMVESAAFSPDGRFIVTASPDKTVRLWSALPDRQTLLLRGHTDRVYAVAFSPDGRRIATGSYDHTARVWDASDGQPLLLLRGHTDRVFAVAFSPDETQIVTGSDDKTARIWDAANGRELAVLTGHTDRVYSVAYSPDGRRIVTSSDDRTARVWDAATGRPLLLLPGHTDVVETAAFSPDGTAIVTASDDGTARLWDAASGRALRIVAHAATALTSGMFASDGSRVVTSSVDRTARVWDAATGRQLTLLRGHSDQVNTAVFSHDGKHVVTAANDGSVRIWDAANGDDVLLLLGHSGTVNDAVFSPDDRRLATAGTDRTARVWDARLLPLAAQIGWAQAAQFESLSRAERFELGLPAARGVRSWPIAPSRCDEVAAAPYDPDRRAPGVPTERIVAELAAAACTAPELHGQAAARIWYQHGRALLAAHQSAAAAADFARALASGYSAAAFDLGAQLARGAPGAMEVKRALELLHQAWDKGVHVAGFEIGRLFEQGIKAQGDTHWLLAPDSRSAWHWYRLAADAGSPDALARYGAAHEDAAALARTADARTAELLAAFGGYAAAAARAYREDWPDEAWRAWRYRRAALARSLAQAGSTEQAAAVFERATSFEKR